MAGRNTEPCDNRLSRLVRGRHCSFNFYAGCVVGVASVLALLRYKYLRKRVDSFTVLELDLNGCTFSEQQPDSNQILSMVVEDDIVHVHTLVHAIRTAAKDSRVLGLVVKLGQINTNLVQLQELRNAVMELRSAGKKTLCYAHTFKEFANASAYYWFATAFENIYISPSGSVNVSGAKLNSMFLRGFLEKLNLDLTLVTRKSYKTAPNMLTQSQFTEEHRETAEYILTSVHDQFVDDVAEGRGMTTDQVRELFSGGPYTASAALDSMLIDGLKYENEFYDEVLNAEFGSTDASFFLKLRRRLMSKKPYELLYVKNYFERAIGRYYQNAKTKIGYINLIGTIYLGESQKTWNGLDISAGSETVLLAIREAIACPTIRAIILRIDSGGGSAQASDVIANAVCMAKQSGKKVVVSMGQAAASGGYYVAAHADKIVADPMTLTGSIGVFAGKLNLSRFCNQFGVTFDSVQTSPSGEYYDALSGFNEDNRAKLESFADTIYDQFKGHVCQGRRMTPDQVEVLAQGRIWMGKLALEKGLVDVLGGLETAIDVTKKELGLPLQTAVSLVSFPRPTSLLEKFLTRPQQNSRDIRKRGSLRCFALSPFIHTLLSAFTWLSGSTSLLPAAGRSLAKLAPLLQKSNTDELFLSPCTLDLEASEIASQLSV